MLQLLEKKMYVISGIFGLVFLFLILFFVWPLLIEIKNNSENLISIKNNIVAFRIQNDQIENFKKNYKDYRPNLEKMNQSFVDPKNLVNFIKFLENTAQDSGIEAKISLLPASQQENQSVLAFQLFSSEDFLRIMDFSEKLEAGPYLVKIKDLIIRNSVSQNSSKNVPGKVDATFLINALAKQ